MHGNCAMMSREEMRKLSRKEKKRELEKIILQ